MYNSLLLPGDGTNLAQNNTFLDGSTNNFAITRNGNTTQGTFSPYGPNWSNYFDGAGDSLQAPSGSSISGTGDFTAECWIYPTAVPGTYNVIGCSDTSGGLTMFGLNANGTIFMGRSLIDVQATTANSLSYNTWNHIAVSRFSGTVRLFINGVQGYSGSITTNYNAGVVRLGTDGGGSALPYTGYVSNFRIVPGTALYTTAFTPSTTPLTAIAGTSLLTSQSNRFIDNSTNAFAITVNGNTNIQRFSPFSPTQAYSAGTIGGSAYFDGNSDYLNVPDNDSWALGNNFTIECWVYFTTTSGIQQFINQRASPSDAWQFLYNYPNSGDLTFKFADGNVAINRTWSPTVGQWYHIAVTRSSNTWYLFANGVQLGATATNSTTFPNIAASVWVGTLQNPTAESFVGYMCDMRVVKSSVYTSAFTPPTAPLTAVANTQLLLSNTNGGIIDNAMINNLETVGNAQISTTQSKFGSSSMAFDGTGDYLTQPSSQNFNFGSGNFTMEGWFYQTGLSSSYPGIVSNPLAWGNAGAWSVLSSHASSGVRKLQFHCYNYDANNPLLLGTTSLSDNTWYYFAVTRSGTTFRLFLNGTVEATATFSGSVTSVSSGLVVGINQTAYAFQGYIDDLRITKGYARYTTTFTPPTAALPTY
jgi:hypothetical protein